MENTGTPSLCHESDSHTDNWRCWTRIQWTKQNMNIFLWRQLLLNAKMLLPSSNNVWNLISVTTYQCRPLHSALHFTKAVSEWVAAAIYCFTVIFVLWLLPAKLPCYSKEAGTLNQCSTSSGHWSRRRVSHLESQFWWLSWTPGSQCQDEHRNLHKILTIIIPLSLPTILSHHGSLPSIRERQYEPFWWPWNFQIKKHSFKALISKRSKCSTSDILRTRMNQHQSTRTNHSFVRS